MSSSEIGPILLINMLILTSVTPPKNAQKQL